MLLTVNRVCAGAASDVKNPAFRVPHGPGKVGWPVFWRSEVPVSVTRFSEPIVAFDDFMGVIAEMTTEQQFSEGVLAFGHYSGRYRYRLSTN